MKCQNERIKILLRIVASGALPFSRAGKRFLRLFKISVLNGVLSIAVFFAYPVFASENLTDDVVSGWSFSRSLSKNYKSYGYKIVSKKKGHPVRSGKYSIRFEVRPGDCGWGKTWNDCQNDRERHELSSSGKRFRMESGNYWFSWSFYIPKDFRIVFPTKTALGQFHQYSGHVIWLFQNDKGGYWVDNQVTGRTTEKKKILNDNEIRGKWTDILVNVKWTHQSDGYFRVYVNNESDPRYDWSGPTKSEGKTVYYKFGIYRSFVSRYLEQTKSKQVPAQIVYFDEVRRARSRDKVGPRDH